MGYKKVNDLTLATTISDSDTLEISQGGVAKRATRSLVVDKVQALSPSTSSRALDSAGFQPSSTKNVLCVYSIKLSAQSLLLAGSEIKVELLSDASSTPTTVRGTISSATGGVLNIINSNTLQLTYEVPVGHYVILKSTKVSGGAGGSSASIVSQTETVKG